MMGSKNLEDANILLNLSISERGNEQITTLCSHVGDSRNHKGPRHNNPSSNNIYAGPTIIGGRQWRNIYKLHSPHNLDDKTQKKLDGARIN
jgi:hypothetical protein